MAYNTNAGKQSFQMVGGQTNISFNFKIFEDTDMLVYLTPMGETPNDEVDLLTLNADYTVLINGDNGGTVTLLSPATLGDTVILQRELEISRDIEYQTSGDLRASVLNSDQDYQTYLISDNLLKTANSLLVANSDVNVDSQLPSVIPNYYLRVNATGTGFSFVQGTVQAQTEFDQDNFRVFNGEKKIGLNADNITSGETRNIIMPDKDVSLDEFLGEIEVLTEKATPAQDDVLLIEDSANSFIKKKIKISSLSQDDTVSIIGSAIFTNTDNRILLTGVGLITLAIGDVITISGSVSNNGEYTVEHINGDGSGLVSDNNSIIVNYEHRGQTTSKALVNETATVTITLFGRVGKVTNGIGQGECIPASGRLSGITYTNDTNRPIWIEVYQGGLNSSGLVITKNSIVSGQLRVSSIQVYNFATFIVLPNSTYSVEALTPTTFIRFAEIR